MATATVHDLLQRIDALRAQLRELDQDSEERSRITTELADRYADLLSGLDLIAYPVEPDTDDRLEQIVLTLHGVEISVRGRTGGPAEQPSDPIGDVLVHIEDHRDDNVRHTYPLALDVNETGEQQYT